MKITILGSNTIKSEMIRIVLVVMGLVYFPVLLWANVSDSIEVGVTSLSSDSSKVVGSQENRPDRVYQKSGMMRLSQGVYTRYNRDSQLIGGTSWLWIQTQSDSPPLDGDIHPSTDKLNGRFIGDFNRIGYGLTGIRSTFLFNEEFGYGRNLGSIFPSNGWTGQWSVQGYVKYRGFNLQLEPELNIAENRDFQLFPARYPDWLWVLLYRNYLNMIDQPEKYRDGSFLQLLPGNSALSFTYRDVEMAVGTRYMWWGPAKRNALLLSDNAPGFWHVSINSVRPIVTPMGGVEFQGFWGLLEDSGREPIPYRMFENQQPMTYVPKPDDWRLIQGLMFSWQPKWIPGLHFGMGRTLVTYSENIKRVDHVFSVFRSLTYDLPDVETIELPDLRDRFDDKMAVFLRLVLPEENVEFYTELARSKRAGSLRDFLGRPEHTLAFTLGASKLYELSRRGTFFGIEAELTQTEKQNTWRERYYPAWYTSEIIPHGYTHKGQVLGAGIGPGSNSQYLGLNYLWNGGVNRVGIFGERVIYNNDLYYILFTTSLYRHWADVNFGLSADYAWGPLYFTVNAMMMRTFNYKYIELTTRPGFKYEGLDYWNPSVTGSIQWRF